MSQAIAISVQHVSKAYRIWGSPIARLLAPVIERIAGLLPETLPITRSLKKRAVSTYRDFWALKDIHFEIRKGESIGIIGRNGSGKSTLLQIIARTLQPTSGNVTVNGRVAALLELGSGFNPEFTGRENVYLNGAVLGLSRKQMTDIFEEIAAFADIGDFIEQPVKTYSSGMLMRLAFAVQTAVNPDILIIDEALAVGDAQFVAKCINRIAEFIRSGRTLIFVSHEVGLVKQLTTQAIFLDHGHQMKFGPSPETVLAYTSSLSVGNNAPSADPDRYAKPGAPYLIESVVLTRRDGPEVLESFETGTAANLTLRLSPGDPGPAQLVFSIYNYMGIIVCSNVFELPANPSPERELAVQFTFPRIRLAPGNYRMNFAVRNGIEIVVWWRNALFFKVTGSTTETFIYREDLETSVRLIDQQ